MSSGKNWLRHGFLNTFEHASTRALDALNSLVILWVLSPEVFSVMALAQAHVAPLLLLFIAPETTFYRDYAAWIEKGPAVLQHRLRIFRRFSWFKLILAIALAGGLAGITPMWNASLGQSTFQDRFFAFVWAFAMALAPQISGTDREYLRLSLNLKSLTVLTWLQKVLLLSATGIATVLFPKSIVALGCFTLAASMLTAVFAARMTAKIQGSEVSQEGFQPPPARVILMQAVQHYSLWTHLSGVIQGWIQTIDIFLLGIFKFPARELGLYAAAAKLANLSLALPLAISNLWSIWLGRRNPSSVSEKRKEIEILKKISGQMGALLLVQAGALIFLAPVILRLLARDRWHIEEHEMVGAWFSPMVLGSAMMGSLYLVHGWIWLRKSAARFFAQVYFPWGVGAAIGIGILVKHYGVSAAAWAAGVSALWMVVLLAFFGWRNRVRL